MVCVMYERLRFMFTLLTETLFSHGLSPLDRGGLYPSHGSILDPLSVSTVTRSSFSLSTSAATSTCWSSPSTSFGGRHHDMASSYPFLPSFGQTMHFRKTTTTTSTTTKGCSDIKGAASVPSATSTKLSSSQRKFSKKSFQQIVFRFGLSEASPSPKVTKIFWKTHGKTVYFGDGF